VIQQGPGEQVTLTLDPSAPLERELRGGESHSYRLTLAAGQFLRIVVEQRGIDVVVKLFGPSGQPLAEVDSPNGPQGPEPLSILSEQSGEYTLEVRALEKAAAPGRYEVRIQELRAATLHDRQRIAGEMAFAEASPLAAQQTAEPRLQALEKYQTALELFRLAGDRQREGDALHLMGRVYDALLKPKEALDYYNQAVEVRRAIGDRFGEATSLHFMGTLSYDQGWPTQSLEYCLQALMIRQEIGDRHGESLTHHITGLVYDSLGEPQKALEHYQQALTIRRALKQPQREAVTLNNMAAVYDSMSEPQKAIDHYEQSLRLSRSLGNRQYEAMTLTNVGLVYWSLGETQTALDYYDQALSLNRAIGYQQGEANTLANTGLAHWSLGDGAKALDYFRQAIPLWRAVRDRYGEARTLNNIARVHHAQGQSEKALEHFEHALALNRAVKDRPGEATTLTHIGTVYADLGQYEKALDYFNQALSLQRAVQHRSGEAATLAGLARVERERGHLIEARAQAEAALGIIESIRTKVTSQDLRASYLASKQNYYAAYADVLMQLHRREPAGAHDAAALQVNERARARSLLDILAEARADIRQGVDPTLLDRERTMQQQLNAKADRLTQLLSGQPTEDQTITAKKELDRLLIQYREIQSQIRTSSPKYAALTQPGPLSLKEIQQQVLDEDSVLLEYALGEQRGFLWLVTPASIKSFELPKRAEVEATARRFYELVTAHRAVKFETKHERQARLAKATAEYSEAARALSDMLLGPVAAELQKKRLLIVADGALQYVPFAALPKPGIRDQGSGISTLRIADCGSRIEESPIPNPQSPIGCPLIVDHEIVNLPSASVLAALRRELAGRKPAAKTVVVLADPVFSQNDERINRRGAEQSAIRHPPSAIERSAEESGIEREGPGFPRLAYTRREAETIMALVPEGKGMKALDFQASRARATSPDLGQYRLIHFATHAILNNQHPALSGIVLSLVDERGQPQDGFLRLHDLYNLNLSADLVVLSACQTALGKEIKGEGLVGLTRGFMYAGAARVVASLWKVNDEATAELMRRFYQGMLRDGRRPAAALRAAQVSMWKEKRWSAPFYWAGFVLQGEWR
jgi:CHAT domain-containing protein